MIETVPRGLPLERQLVGIIFPSRRALDEGASMEEILRRQPRLIIDKAEKRVVDLANGFQMPMDKIFETWSYDSAHGLYFGNMTHAVSHLKVYYPKAILPPDLTLMARPDYNQGPQKR